MAVKDIGQEIKTRVLRKECPNGCGSLSDMKQPGLIPVGADCVHWIDMNLNDIDPDDLPWWRLIVRICLECGYYETVNLTEDQFERYSQGKLKIQVGNQVYETKR